MPSFLSICLTLLRIAICTTHVIQGLLIELHNAVERLMDGQYPSITPPTEDQSSNLSLAAPISSDVVNIDKVAPSTPPIGSSDFAEVSSTRNVFVRLNRQSPLSESEKNSESLILIETKNEQDLEDYRYSKQPVSRSSHFDATKENNSKFQENEMSKSSRNEPAASITTTNENVFVSEEPTEVRLVANSLDSENAADKSEVEASNEPAVNPLVNQVETTSSERWESSVHSTSSIQDSQKCVSSKESNIDVTTAIKALSERTLSKKFDMDENIERHLQLGDYDKSTLGETKSNVKSSNFGSSIEKSIGKQDTDLEGKHLQVTPSPPKRISGKTLVKAKDDTFIPAALDQSLRLPRYRVDSSTGNIKWKTDIPLDSTPGPKRTSPCKEDCKTTEASYNKQGFKCEFQKTSTTKEILYKSIRDRVPTPPPEFPIAESSSENELLEDKLSKSYECTAVSTAQNEFKPVGQRKLTPAARFPTRLSTDTDEDVYYPMLDFNPESPPMEEVEFKSTCERRPTPPPRIMYHEQTSSSGTESGIFSEHNSLTIFVPLREENRHPAFRSPLKSEEGGQCSSVRFIDQPLLTKNDRIDSIEEIEFAIKPTCESVPPEAIVLPQTLSQISSPILTDSDTPENIKYIEKASQLLKKVSTHPDKEQEYCDINSSATEFPVSGSPSATESEDAIGSESLRQLVKSLSSSENDKSPSKECNTPTVRFLLPESHIERDSKGMRREMKFRKPPNETSTSEEENEIKISRKRRASPGKFHKSPKKFAETTALKIRGYKFSPQKVSNEKNSEDWSTSENTSATRSLDFELRIQQNSVNDANLPTSADQKNLEIETEKRLSTRTTTEDQVAKKSNSQQATSKSESADERSSTGSNSETTSSNDIAADSVLECTEGISSQMVTDNPAVVADFMVDCDEKGCYSASEGTKGLFPSIENETLALQDNAHEAGPTFKGDAPNNILVNYSDESREISFTGHSELLDTNSSSQESKCLEIEELPSDKNYEEKIDEKPTPQFESMPKLQALSEDKQNLNFSSKLEATDPTQNSESSQRSSSPESSSSDETINEKSGSDSSHEGTAVIASQLEHEAEIEKFSNADRTADKNSTEGKSESFKLSSSDESTDKEPVTNFSLEADTQNINVHKNYIDLVCNVDSQVEIDRTLNISESKATAEFNEPTELMEVLSNSSHTETIESRSEEKIHETEQQLEAELSNFIKANFSGIRISALSPVYEVSENGTASSGSYSESEATNAICVPSTSSASEDECIYLEQESPLFESQPRISAKNGQGSSEPETAFYNVSQMSTSIGEDIHPNATPLDPSKQLSRIGKETGEINSETETVSSLSSSSKSSNNEVDEESTIGKVAETEKNLGYQLSTSNIQLQKDHTSKSYFYPVLEELIQRIQSAPRSNSPTENPSFLSSPDVEDGTKGPSDPQLSTTLTTKVKKVYNVKNYFDTVLKELVQRVKPTTVSDSPTSIKDENSSVAKIDGSSMISAQTSPGKDFMAVENASILELSNDIIQNVNEAEIKNVVETVRSETLITGAENVKQDYREFELHIVPQPVPEIAIESKVEVWISNETSSDLSEIKIVDSKTAETELNAPDESAAETPICQLTAIPEKGDDSYSRCPFTEVSTESIPVEMFPSTENLNSLTSSTIEAFVEITKNDSTSNIFVNTVKDDFTEEVLHEVTKDDPSENPFETINKYHAENTLIKVTKEYSTENMDVEITKEDSTESNLVDVSNDDPTEIDSKTTNCSHGNTFVEMEKDDSTDNNFVELLHDRSSESNAMNTSTNLDSSIAEEVNDNDKGECSNENKPWKKKQRKTKKKRRN